jgi:hypothetical protein
MWPEAPRGPLPSSSPPGPQQQHQGPTPMFPPSPPHPWQAFLGGVVGPAFSGLGAHGGLLPMPPGFLPRLTLHVVLGPVSFSGPLHGPPLWLPPQPAPPPPGLLQAPPDAVWDQHDLAKNFNIMMLVPPPNMEWYMDSRASSHKASNSSILTHVFTPNYSTCHSIFVDNGSLLPVTSTGHTYFPIVDCSLYLYDVLVSPNIIKNLISVHRFTTDNLISVEFDPYGLSVKDLQTRNVIIKCNSSGQLYPLFPSAHTSPPQAFLVDAQSSTIWHHHLGHLGDEFFSTLAHSSAIICNKFDHTTLCHAFRLGRHARLPFSTSSSCASQNFDLIHCD